MLELIARWCLLLCAFRGTFSSSLIKRIRENKNSEDTIRLDLPLDAWMQIPQHVQDVLVSIDDKLRGLDTFSYTLKLARLDFSLEQLIRRLENIETKLGRLETKFDVRMEKVEEVVISKDIKEEFSNEHLSRRMENLNEKINIKAAFLDAKIDVRMERIFNKLELLERDLHNSVEDILEKIIKNDERHAQFETDVKKKMDNIEECGNNISDLKLYLKEDFQRKFEKSLENIGFDIKEIGKAIKINCTNIEEIRVLMDGLKNNCITSYNSLQEAKISIENISNNCNSEARQKNSMNFCELDKNTSRTHTEEQLNNLTATVHRAVKMGEEKLQELDMDVELYTKKVINGIQELWKSSDELKMFVLNTLEQGNRTREIVRQEFVRLLKQIEPLPQIEPKLSQISENLDKKVTELSKTVDNSFAALLIAQNTFIGSCQRIQHEEVHIYDIIQQVVFEMRNRSLTDMQKINYELQKYKLEFNKSMEDIRDAIFFVGNSTSKRIYNMEKNEQVRCGAKLKWKDISTLCQQSVLDFDMETEDREAILNHVGRIGSASDGNDTFIDYDSDYNNHETDYIEK